jgi:transglutaminase-like putative cysteine protease
MTLTSVFRFSLYALVALAASMLAYGEESFFPSGLTVLLSMFVLFFGDRHDRLTIGPLLANLLGLIGLVAAGFEFFGTQFDSRLLAGAHFLVYITWIVLLQTKGIRQYWWLSALSLLQVALGSVLTSQSGTYGLLLLAYLPLALWTLSVFTLYQGAYELGGLDHEHPSGPQIANDAMADARSTAAWKASPPAAVPLMRLRQHFANDRQSTVRHAIQQDSPGQWIVPRFVFGVMGLAAAGLALGLVMFLFVPRVSFGGARFHGESSRGRTLTGFSGEVHLGQVGQILESIDRVMRVRLFDRFDSQNEKPLSIEDFVSEFGLEEPLFRGAVLDDYGHGRWRGAKPDSLRPQQMPPKPLEPGMIRQEYTLELGSAEHLFAMRPISLARLDPNGPINYSHESAALSASAERRDPIEYFVYSRRRTDAERADRRNQFGHLPGMKNLSQFGRDSYLALPDQNMDGLIALARERTLPERLVGDDESSPAKRKALTLEAHLRDSREFSYSLNMEVENPNRDPVEEFLLDRRRGHCEYFASALALMLRAVGIPSRLVIGFKGADFHESANPADSYYEVQQRHAHAWVEAFVDNEWIVLDPTPAEREESVRQVAANAGFWKNAKNSLTSLWSTYVVSLSLDRQQQALYDPLTGSVATGWTSIRGLLNQAAGGIAVLKDMLASPQRYFSTRGTVLAFATIGILLVAGRMARQSFGRFVRRLPAGSRRGVIRRIYLWLVARLTGRQVEPARVVVAFYEQFQDLVQAVGLARRDDQTQREFARDVERALCDRLAPADLGRFPTQLCELFYRVRFGDGILRSTEAADVEGRLVRLAGLIHGPRDARQG